MSVLITQLERLLENARRIRKPEFQEVVAEYKDMFDKHAFRLRPSVGSISLVSCAGSTPQLGFSKMTNGKTLKARLDALRKGEPFEIPCRPTPEKLLQSWLISEAMKNGNQLHAVERAMHDQHSYWFVTDEIALRTTDDKSPAGKGKRVVADLLAVRLDANRMSEIVNIELKSERSTKTHGQVMTFWDFMGPDERALWHELADTMLGGERRSWKKAGSNSGIVIWPRPMRRASSVRAADLKTKYPDIETVCYSGPPFTFEREHRA